ncbi:MAG: hypothetical protein IJX12_06915, partial [Lachnospiraceae bacterium]|nr:hypothetical protein [Lachnospiraceae bacterium]
MAIGYNPKPQATLRRPPLHPVKRAKKSHRRNTCGTHIHLFNYDIYNLVRNIDFLHDRLVSGE